MVGIGRLCRNPISKSLVDLRQVVAQPRLEVVGIMGGCDFDRTRAEFGVDVLVGDDDEFAVDERVRQRRADQMLVALVIGMDGDGGVAEHRLDPSGGDHDVWLVVVE